MDCLLANRFDPRELLEAISEMNRHLVQILVDSSNQCPAHRVIVLYFLLCLYEKQPRRLARKIRLTCEDALSLDDLCNEMRASKGHEDSHFAWQRLKKDGAIEFVEERLVYGPSMLRNRNQAVYASITSQPDPIKSFKQESISLIDNIIEPSLEELSSLCSNYESLTHVLDGNEQRDVALELEERKPLPEFLDRAKLILEQYKSSFNN